MVQEGFLFLQKGFPVSEENCQYCSQMVLSIQQVFLTLFLPYLSQQLGNFIRKSELGSNTIAILVRELSLDPH